MKTHAKDYLVEFTNGKHCPDWLKYLVYQIINTNRPISDTVFDTLVKNLSEKKAFVLPQLANNTTKTQRNIRLVSLKHISGVNALAENQIIKFHDNVTILNGLNGSGKSSYFRIINEIVGGNEKKEILSNIYNDTDKTVSVELIYKLGNTEKSLLWDNKRRGFEDLNNCRVFDSSYLKGFLDVRKVDETLVYPLGLNLFAYIASDIDKLKSKFKDLSLSEKNAKPQIDFTNLSENIKNAFLIHTVSPDIKSKIESQYNFSDEQTARLDKVCNDIKQLEQTNIQDTISLKRGIVDAYKTFCNYVKFVFDAMNTHIENVQNLINEYKQKKDANDIAKNKFEVLKSIPKNDSAEWKYFISDGEKYRKLVGTDEVCPYCHQVLDDKALNLLQAYGEFLQDNTEKELGIVEDKIQNEILNIQKINVNIPSNDDVNLFLATNKVGDQSASDYIKKYFSIINSQKTNLIDLLNKRTCESAIEFNVDITSIINLFTPEIDVIEKSIIELSSEQSEKQKKITGLENERKLLLENKSISEQKVLFIKWFENDLNEQRFGNIAKLLTTTEITSLSNKAYDALLTDTLRINFEKELRELGKHNIQVNLLKASASKGAFSTKLTLVNNHALKNILSEGEQKAVGLALFLAEVKSQNKNTPIILDDPVNSLDHQIAGKFAERLLQLDNQIIIFNHNRLFLDAFETTSNGHICKTIDTVCNKAKGKHIRVYSVQDEGKNLKGVLVQYQENTAKHFLDETTQLISQSPFTEWEKTAVLIRQCVEHCIDEIVFNKQIPTRFSIKSSRINWDGLKKLNSNDEIVEKLHFIHDRVSGGKIHNGEEAIENPITVDEYRQFLNELESIISSK